MTASQERYLPAAVWTFWDAAGLFLAGLVGSLAAISLGIVFNGGEELTQIPLLLTSSIGQAVVTLGLLAYMSRSRGAGSWDLDFGLRFEQSDWRGLFYGIGLQLVVTLLVTLPLLVLMGVDDPPEQDVAEIVGSASSLVGRLAVALVVVVVAPLIEELLFRGVILSRLRRGFGPAASIAVSAALFSVFHLIDPDTRFLVPGLFVIGVVLGIQALRTDRIGLAITTHAGVNLLAVVGLFLDVGV